MRTTELISEAKKLAKRDRMAILAIIDLKTDSDMEKVLTKLDVMQNQMDSRFKAIQTSTTLLGILLSIIGIASTVLILIK